MLQNAKHAHSSLHRNGVRMIRFPGPARPDTEKQQRPDSNARENRAPDARWRHVCPATPVQTFRRAAASESPNHKSALAAGGCPMFRHFFLMAARSFARHKLYRIINIA